MSETRIRFDRCVDSNGELYKVWGVDTRKIKVKIKVKVKVKRSLSLTK